VRAKTRRQTKIISKRPIKYTTVSLENIPVDLFFFFVDYRAKKNICKAGGTASCEGESKGFLAHGSMLVYRSSSTAERAATS
jgi:hypothetical protein